MPGFETEMLRLQPGCASTVLHTYLNITDLDVELVLVPVMHMLPGLPGHSQLIYAGTGPVL